MHTPFRQWLKPPIFPDDTYKSYIARLLHVLWMHITGLLIVLGVVVIPLLAVRRLLGMVIVLGMLAVQCIVMILLQRGNVRAAAILFVLALWLTMLLTFFLSGGQAIAFVAIAMIAGLLLGVRVAVGIGVVSGIILLGNAWFESTGYNLPRYFEMQPLFAAILLITGLYISLVALYVSSGAITDSLTRMQQELSERRRAETMLRLIMDQMAAIVWTVDTDLRFTSSQGAALAYLNLRPGQVVGMTLEEYLQDRADPVVGLARRALAGESITYEQEWQGRTFETHIEPLRNEVGRIIGCVAVSLDVSPRKTTEAALRLSEERYRMLAANLPDSAIILFDRDLRFVLVDGPELDRTGYSKATMEGRTLHEALPEEFAQLVEPNMRAVLTGKPGFADELPFGDQLYHYTYLPLQNDTGATVYGLILAQNVTVRKRDEASLRENEARYQALFELGTEAIFLIDNEDGHILEANTAATDMYGYTRDELLQLRNVDLSAEPAETRQATVEAQPGSVRLIPLRYHRRKDGTIFPVEISARIFFWKDRPVHVAAIRDITERQQADMQRERLIEQLEAKNAELERFTYTVSHDLKSPLVTIASFVGFLEQDAHAGRTDRMQQDVLRIRTAIDRMHLLLDDLLELSRIGRLINPPEQFSFASIVQEALELVQGQLIEQGIVVRIGENLPIIHGDRARLVEVVQNLIDNAAKFMGDQAAPTIEIGAEQRDLGLVFVVRDNGIGIDPRYQQKIFGLFEKLSARSIGTGIGLALVKRIIEIHGGRIWVESRGDGYGSAFCFTLPGAVPQQPEKE